ncbi:hypothetical protein L3N51_00365 [Metallosphaera sp. J1]|uniref:hypothetical protein n=1 Tax=Metallosphaera javensis (ex Hofmann et al. 2022) TaxID=99938 RepID=UPI001EDDC7F7|nr:hypothetical protein [Metallosphaera javensis (ex Hofmann et al. 2022)]MCG3108084.1 hypothetical protein [Metallosphaera javensis (ex Hofmann et al. 2022)]
MDFLDKKHRTVLVAVAKEGYGGISIDQLFATLSPFLSKDTIVKLIEDLYFSQYIVIVRDSGEIRYIASKSVRNAMISLELQRYRLTKFLESLKSLGNSQEKPKPEEISNLVEKGLRIVSTGYIQLLSEVPELTIPEYTEMMELLSKELFGKLIQTVEKETPNDEMEKLVELIGKYRGERDAEVIKNLMFITTKQNQPQSGTSK